MNKVSFEVLVVGVSPVIMWLPLYVIALNTDLGGKKKFYNFYRVRTEEIFRGSDMQIIITMIRKHSSMISHLSVSY